MNCRTLSAAMALSLAAAPACATSYHFMTFDATASGPAATVIDGINNHGQAVGYYVTGLQSGPTYHAFTLHSDGSGFASIDRPGAVQTGAGGINDLGVVAGVSVDASFATNGFLLDGTGYHDIALPVGFGALGSEAIGVDTAGDVVGRYVGLMPGTFQPTDHGFVGQNGAYSTLDEPGAISTELVSITDGGLIGGTAHTSPTEGHGFIYDLHSGLFHDVMLPGAPAASEIGGLNNKGDFVAAALTPAANPIGYDALGYVFSGGMFHPFAAPGAFSTEPLGMNDRGQVVGYYLDMAGVHGFVATPAPEPASWALLTVGFGVVGGSLRRRRANMAMGPARA